MSVSLFHGSVGKNLLNQSLCSSGRAIVVEKAFSLAPCGTAYHAHESVPANSWSSVRPSPSPAAGSTSLLSVSLADLAKGSNGLNALNGASR